MLSNTGRERLRQKMLGNQLGLGRKHTEEVKEKISQANKKHPTAEGMKFCGACKQLLPIENFHKRSSSRDGLHVICKVCSAKRAADYYKRNCEDQKQKSRERNKKSEYAINKRNRNLQVNYGISSDEYQAMFERQHGCCAICGANQSALNYKLYVDHSHKNGRVRGLLCKPCNSAIGLMNDDAQILANAIRYLEKHEPIPERSGERS